MYRENKLKYLVGRLNDVVRSHNRELSFAFGTRVNFIFDYDESLNLICKTFFDKMKIDVTDDNIDEYLRICRDESSLYNMALELAEIR